MRSIATLLLALGAFTAAAPHAYAGMLWDIRVVRAKNNPIDGLALDPQEAELDELDISGQTIPLLKIPGTFTHRGLSLLYDNRPLVLSERSNDSFWMTVPLTSKRTLIEISTVTIDGLITKERIEFIFGDYSAYQAVQAERHKPGLGLQPSLGITSLSYSETGIAPYQAVMLSAKVGLGFALAPPVWDGAVNVFGNLLPIAGDSSGVVARFIGLNFRVGYAVRAVRDPWKLALMVGYYNNRMSVTDDRFGYKNVSGPQFFPMLRKRIGEGKAVYGYLKYAPVAPGGWIASLGDREIAFGMGANWTAGKSRPLSVSLDYADLKLKILDLGITSNTLTLSVGTSI